MSPTPSLLIQSQQELQLRVQDLSPPLVSKTVPEVPGRLAQPDRGEWDGGKTDYCVPPRPRTGRGEWDSGKTDYCVSPPPTHLLTAALPPCLPCLCWPT